MRTLLLALALTATAQAQWEILPTPTTADLRGIHSVSPEIAWTSGTNGTVLRTVDAGAHWSLCPTPPGAEHLDFRGIQAFDAETAIVMSSGKGTLSRLYKTTDACAHWTLLFTNPDPEGFWDAVQFADQTHGFILGDPVPVSGSGVKRVVFKQTIDGGKTWTSWERTVSDFAVGEDTAAFAASNSSMFLDDRFHAVVATGGKGGSAIGFPGNNEFPTDRAFCGDWCPPVTDRMATRELNVWWELELPFPRTESGGIFSIASNDDRDNYRIVAVGGDYKVPESPRETAAYTDNRMSTGFIPAQTPPHGYRSAVAYSPEHKTWITVGPNGTDISNDDGRNWRPLKPDPQTPDPPDADKNWNALSLPYVVGPHGRIGKLRPTALP